MEKKDTGLKRPGRFAPILFSFFLSCAVFQVGDTEHPRTAPPFAAFGDVGYELINWDTQDEAVRHILVESLVSSGSFRSLYPSKGGGNFIQIILENYPGENVFAHRWRTNFWRALGEQVDTFLFSRSLFIFPLVRRHDRTITFLVWKDGVPSGSYVYRSDYRIFVGWPVLIAFPWSRARSIALDMHRISGLFTADALRDGILK